MRIVVGLGNPGRAYADTRHNVGFAVVEELARRWRLPLGRTRRGVRASRGVIAGELAMLVEPQVYMNLSGEALTSLDPPVATKDLIVVHDDLDLECGRVHVKRGGGTAGHHGLDSIVERYGSNFARIRVGVGRAPDGTDTAEYVLSRFEDEEGEIVAAAVERAADAVECVLRAGEETAMNRFNVRSHGSTAAAAARIGRK
jgi:PTH1 family peptidyl-tRNA hydrolase